jgi:hypothetical protein
MSLCSLDSLLSEAVSSSVLSTSDAAQPVRMKADARSNENVRIRASLGAGPELQKTVFVDS